MIDLNKYYISSTFQGASGGSEGRAGYVPQALSGDELKFLRGDGTWQTVQAGSAQVDFLPLSGGTLTGNLSVYGNTFINNNLTVGGNLTALGTATFANTIFTTTSALSVVNTGPGPALYVYQAAGPYDVASFYDGDGIEVLHVGNAGPGGFGKVGVNESFPNEELTVRGSISATETIYANSYLSAGVNLLQILGPTVRQFDYVVTDGISYNYCGTAPNGSTTSDTTWTIKRLLFTSAGTLLSSGTVNNSIWNNRYSYSY